MKWYAHLVVAGLMLPAIGCCRVFCWPCSTPKNTCRVDQARREFASFDRGAIDMRLNALSSAFVANPPASSRVPGRCCRSWSESLMPVCTNTTTEFEDIFWRPDSGNGSEQCRESAHKALMRECTTVMFESMRQRAELAPCKPMEIQEAGSKTFWRQSDGSLASCPFPYTPGM